MRILYRLPGDTLLSLQEPERLFSFGINEAQAEYKQLAKVWHPDVCTRPNATEVFSHLAKIYAQSQALRSEKKWIEPAEKIEDEKPGIKAFKTVDGHIKRIDFLTVREFELGTAYIGDYHVTYVLRREFDDLFKNGVDTMERLSFKDNKMQAEMVRYLPLIQDIFRTPAHSAVVLRKTPDCLLLSDVLKYMGGTLNPIGHIGWVLNVSYNIACYLQYAGLTHNGISSDTYFVSPVFHSGMLLGGWWYACKRKDRMLALPERTLAYAPPDIVRRKRSGFRTDLELIRAMGRELLGDVSGASLRYEAGLPEPIVQYLNMPSSGSAVEDYKTYKNKVLEACWPRKYIELKLEAKDIYARR